MAQMSLCVNSCEKTFQTSKFNSNKAYVGLRTGILFVNFVNIKQVLLC